MRKYSLLMVVGLLFVILVIVLISELWSEGKPPVNQAHLANVPDNGNGTPDRPPRIGEEIKTGPAKKADPGESLDPGSERAKRLKAIEEAAKARKAEEEAAAKKPDEQIGPKRPDTESVEPRKTEDTPPRSEDQSRSSSTFNYADGKEIKHIVESGDLVSKLLAKYYANTTYQGVSIPYSVKRELVELANPQINNLDVIRENDELVFPSIAKLQEYYSRHKERVTERRKKEALPLKFDADYIIQEGDQLGTISERLCGKSGAWPVIADANPQTDPEKMKIGDRIKIPPRSEFDKYIAKHYRSSGGTARGGRRHPGTGSGRIRTTTPPQTGGTTTPKTTKPAKKESDGGYFGGEGIRP